MASTPWILIFVLAALVLFGILAAMLFLARKRKHEPNYHTLFILGLTWIPLGFVFDNPAFWIMGIVLMAVGLANRKKWKKNRPSWKKMDRNERILFAAIIILMAFMALAGVVVFFLLEKGII